MFLFTKSMSKWPQVTEDKTSIENSQLNSLAVEATEDKTLVQKTSAENLSSERQQKAKSKLLQLLKSELCT